MKTVCRHRGFGLLCLRFFMMEQQREGLCDEDNENRIFLSARRVDDPRI